MRGKLMFLGGMAAGYVLGTRHGRERYEQLVRNARKVIDHPTVQEARGVVQAEASRLYAGGKEVVSAKLGNTRMGERLRHNGAATESDSRPVGAASQGLGQG